MTDYSAICEAVVNCDKDQLIDRIKKSLADKCSPEEILNQGLIAGMDVVGERMENGDMFIPEVLMAAQAMGEGLAILKPLLGEDVSVGGATVVIGTVKGDLHDIGKNLVAMLMEGAGMTVFNLGVDIEPQEFVKQIKEKKANIICLSALLTTTMPMMKKTIEAIIEAGLRNDVKVMVGGAPVTKSFAEEIGADGYASDAGSAARLAKSLVG